MTSQPTYPVHPTGDVPGLPAVSATDQQARRRKTFVASRKRRRKDPSGDQPDPEKNVDASQQPADQADQAEGHIDCLA